MIECWGCIHTRVKRSGCGDWEVYSWLDLHTFAARRLALPLMMLGHLKGLDEGPGYNNCPCLVSSLFFSPGAGLSHNLTP